MASAPAPTFGERRVRVDFAATGRVARIKHLCAAVIDECNAEQPDADGEYLRLMALAMTHVETAAMFAVKAATYAPPPTTPPASALPASAVVDLTQAPPSPEILTQPVETGCDYCGISRIAGVSHQLCGGRAIPADVEPDAPAPAAEPVTPVKRIRTTSPPTPDAPARPLRTKKTATNEASQVACSVCGRVYGDRAWHVCLTGAGLATVAPHLIMTQ